MPIYRLATRLNDRPPFESPTLVAALDSWVDAGSSSTMAARQIAESGETVVTFEPDELFDYRARRPTLEIVDGRPADLDWPELNIRHARIGRRDVLVLSGPEPDYRWRAFADAAVELAKTFGVREWISLGAIPAAVPHTRSVPILGTESKAGLLRGEVQAGPAGVLRVPAAAISVLDMAIAAAGIPALGYFAQVPHYVSGPYPAAAIELLRAVARHLDQEIGFGSLSEDADQLRDRLNIATGADETTRTYVERLEAMVDEARLPSGDDLISDIERFLRDRGTEGSQRS